MQGSGALGSQRHPWLSQLHLGTGNWEAKRLEAPCLSSQTGPLWNSKVSGKEARCHWSQWSHRSRLCAPTVSSLPLWASKGCTWSSPTEGAASFPGMAVITSGTVAGLQERDGVGIAQSDTQQVSSGKGKKDQS